MTTAVYAGSFDPVTRGHLSVIEAARQVFDRVIIAVGANSQKNPLFPDTIERITLIEEALPSHTPMIDVYLFDGLLVDFCTRHNATVIVRGLRAVTDFEAEMAIAQANRSMAPGIHTVFFPTEPEHAFISSSTVKEIARHKSETAWNSLSKYVTPNVQAALQRKFKPSV
jgi:pantetheine-phosphate adenylyltransferase